MQIFGTSCFCFATNRQRETFYMQTIKKESKRERERERDRETDRQTDTDRQIDRQKTPSMAVVVWVYLPPKK